MSRSVSAPSSVTKTSPCWNGLIVPGSTFRYGSNFWSWTRRPRAFSSRPREAATIPLPSADTTPHVTNTYFGARALTGFQASSGRGRTSWQLARPEQRVEPFERLVREDPPEPDQPRALDDECHLGPRVVDRAQRHLGLHTVAGELERDALPRLHVEHEQRPGRHRLAEIAGPIGPEHLPAGAGCEAAAVRLDARDARPPVGEVVRLREERPDVVDRREQDSISCVPWQGTPGRRASARARPCALRARAARCSCAWGRPGPSRRGNAGRRARRAAAAGCA